MLWFALAWGAKCVDLWSVNVVDHDAPIVAPPNVVLRFAQPAVGRPELPVLHDRHGNEVPADLVEEANYVELWPSEPLPEGEYEIPDLGSFEVGGPPDEVPPPQPEFVEVWKRASDGVEWTYFEFVPVPVEHHIEIQASEDEAFHEDVHTVLSLHGATATFHRGPDCGVMPEGYDHSARYHLRARTVDLAGNASDWVSHEPARVQCGCRASPVHQGGLVVFAGVALLRRRSRSQSRGHPGRSRRTPRAAPAPVVSPASAAVPYRAGRRARCE
jgi:hypothetical protein